MTYSDKLKDPRWQKKRLEVLARDDFACRCCGATDKTLQVHHHFYAKGEPWETPVECLSAYCEPCHKSRHTWEKEAHKVLGVLLSYIAHHADDQDFGEKMGLERFVESLNNVRKNFEMGDTELFTHSDLIDAYEAGKKEAKRK